MINTKRDANTVLLSLEFKLESILDGENREKFFLILRITSFGRKKNLKTVLAKHYML